MAIVGLMVMAKERDIAEVEKRLADLPGLSIQGRVKETYVVAVLEEPAATLKTKLELIEGLEGVLAAYAAYANIEDDLENPEQLPGSRALL